LSINLKKLQAAARRRLELKGSVEWRQVPKNHLQRQGLGNEFLSTRTAATKHVISYSDASSLKPADVFHELSKAKLNELGFSAIEAAALNAIMECSKDDPKYIVDANSAVAIVQETLANSILFSLFREESRIQRERMVLRFESQDALTTLHTQMGFWGTAGVSYYLLASKRSDTSFPRELVEKAIARASDGEEIKKEYDAINSILEELPNMNLTEERIPDDDSFKIVEVIVRLFSKKTGLESDE
jgi:hypothetical protein